MNMRAADRRHSQISASNTSTREFGLVRDVLHRCISVPYRRRNSVRGRRPGAAAPGAFVLTRLLDQPPSGLVPGKQ